jgi:hypothetical protein
MAKFVVETPHTDEECLKALDEAVEMGTLEKVVFACKTGEHRSWAYVEADNSKAAIESIIPKFLRPNAVAHEVNKFTAEEIESFHK